MQASLPKFVRMVSVDDLGQGKESVRILGIKWLPTDPVNSKGQENFDEDDGESKMKVNEADPDDGGTKDMGGKTGDFVNMEIAFAYKARPESHNLSKRAVCMHLLLAFYLPSGVKLRKSCHLLQKHTIKMLALLHADTYLYQQLSGWNCTV